MTTKPRHQTAQLEELIVYVLLIVIGAIPVSIAIVGEHAFGIEPTIGSIMMLLGFVGVAAVLWRPSR